MVQSDLLGLIFVYGYVAILLIISEKLLSKYPTFSRKFVHIMVGNVLFILPLFATRFAMTFLAAAPFILLTFLMSPKSPIKLDHKVSTAGHGLGLVYYAISWTVLAFFFFDQPWIIAVGIAAMSYGDGLASLIGQKYGKHKYNILGDAKSIEGSLAMFFVLIFSLAGVLLYYGQPINALTVVMVSLVATLLEGVTPKGLDNLTACFGAVGTFLLMGIL
jgi:dolichol kinase